MLLWTTQHGNSFGCHQMLVRLSKNRVPPSACGRVVLSAWWVRFVNCGMSGAEDDVVPKLKTLQKSVKAYRKLESIEMLYKQLMKHSVTIKTRMSVRLWHAQVYMLSPRGSNTTPACGCAPS